MQPVVTIVVVSLNEGARVESTVSSLRATVPPGTDIIVVDDGSTDGSTAFLDAGDPGPRLVRTSRWGVARARNYGARSGSGDVLVFTDAHIVMPDGWWAPMLHALTDPRVGAAAPAVYDLNDPAAKGYGLRLAMPHLTPGFLGQRSSDPYAVPVLPGCCLAMRRDVFDAAGGFDEGMIHWGMVDAEMAVRLWLLGYELQLIPQIEVGHLFRPVLPYSVALGSVTHNKLRLAFVHFDSERIAAVVDALAVDGDFAEGLALLAERDIALRRDDLRRSRQRDDTWLFARFGDFEFD